MKDTDTRHLSWDEWDELRRPAPGETDFDRVVAGAISRRGLLGGVLAFGSGAAAMGLGTLKGTTAMAQSSRFAFAPIAAQTDYDVHVPEDYEWGVLVRWGDPLFSDAAEFDAAQGGDPATADRVFGENTDGMELYEIDGAQVIAVNHEYVNETINLPNAPAESGSVVNSEEDATKLMMLQGVTVMEVRDGATGWEVVVDSPYNRRITHQTPMTLSGPAAGTPLMQTVADPSGTEVKGTLNNCGAGRTLWGTYLTCEENFNGYFGSTDPEVEITEGWARYGIGAESRYAYEQYDSRFDISVDPNEPNRHGWIVEIDPSDAQSVPVKHTALGRFKHENAAMVQAADGRIVVYMGDDERGEFLYRFVSNGVWEEGTNGSALLEDGTLSVARFTEDGTGEWLPLTPERTGMEMAEMLVHARMAGSAVGATTMDRPEWVAVNPVAAEAYCALTNNSRREAGATNAGGDAMEPAGPNPRPTNEYGQIVRWRPEGGDHGADTFAWDLFVMAGNPQVYDNEYGGSPNVTPGNMFNSPDGMQFSSDGLLWIQTDGDDSNEGDFAGMGNNQMLVGDPETGEIARFLTGPNGSEVTGLTWSADRTTAFVGIQHPGGSWPGEDGMPPRSSVIWVRRNDGQPIG
ncbi:PhoX family protein [Wenxinia marina]|uniref:Putative phosphatase n=1 Tax=Wenxinia marina DSM 24838 TaxID=1123501 RepID=A0A0D0Q5J8_9RHOB|nr:PhoX family phosphatase [Wenxinia marina]KIQ69744.1 putative phosphatase [Wenxinia marina DSM 24838]GGL60831.1 transcriptional initiation protein Tat [Wenxinia marina]